MKINKEIVKISLFMVLGISLIKPEYAKASNNLAQCFNHQVNFKTLAHYKMEQSDYYLVNILSAPTIVQRNVIKVDNNGNCFTVVEPEKIGLYPLSNFLGKEIAYNLLTSRYLTLIKQLGGKEAFTEALLGELEADSPKNFFEDTVIVLKRLGIDLVEKIPKIIIVGEEGIPGHPALQFNE